MEIFAIVVFTPHASPSLTSEALSYQLQNSQFTGLDRDHGKREFYSLLKNIYITKRTNKYV